VAPPATPKKFKVRPIPLTEVEVVGLTFKSIPAAVDVIATPPTSANGTVEAAPIYEAAPTVTAGK
jgi:hypothetical protein